MPVPCMGLVSRSDASAAISLFNDAHFLTSRFNCFAKGFSGMTSKLTKQGFHGSGLPLACLDLLDLRDGISQVA